MKNQLWIALAMGTTLAPGLFGQFAQNNQRQATMVGGGGDRGKCTIEVVVDDVAQVEVRGTTANLRTLSGQPAQWRRFQCTGPIPGNPGNFQFAGVDGRGRQTLVRDPRNGGTAVIEIDDKDGGSEGYTFDLTWDNSGQGYIQNYGGNNQQNRDSYPNSGNGQYRQGNDQYRPNYRDSDYYRRYNHGFTTAEATRVCQENVYAQAARRFRGAEMHFHDTNFDDQAGRQDWVTGTLDVHRNNREERYGFACSVDFQAGQVRSADLDNRPLQEDPRWRQ